MYHIAFFRNVGDKIKVLAKFYVFKPPLYYLRYSSIDHGSCIKLRKNLFRFFEKLPKNIYHPECAIWYIKIVYNLASISKTLIISKFDTIWRRNFEFSAKMSYFSSDFLYKLWNLKTNKPPLFYLRRAQWWIMHNKEKKIFKYFA